MLRVVLLLLALAQVAATPASAKDIAWRDAQQLVLVLTEDWDASQGSLQAFDRRDGRWMAHLRAAPVSIGRAGAAWGIGLHETQAGVQKREGDGRSPAGVFAIGTAFGYATSERSGLRYRTMSASDYCIDVSESPFYNQIVDSRVVGSAAVQKSTEPMRRDLHASGDQRYKLGFVIEHNPQSLAARGSCIFAHLWGSQGQATAGCTAMEEAVLRDLTRWLDSQRSPVFVLLPKKEYERLKSQWRLP